MNAPGGDSLTRDLIRALVVALEQGLAKTAAPAALGNAIDTAQLLGLPALAQALAAFHPRTPRTPDAEVERRSERLKDLVAECARVGNLDPLRAPAVTAELSSWSDVPRAEAAPATIEAETPTLTLAEVLADLPSTEPDTLERARRLRVSAPVAAALRAALDWLEKEGPTPRPLRLSSEESVIEVVCPSVSMAGLPAAEKVLAGVGGILMPASALGVRGAPAGAWVVRVPSLAARRSHLMLHQGDLALAVPWHAVLRLYMVPAIELERGLGRLGHVVLERLRPVAEPLGERPVVLIGHGLKRAYLVADRLVWRLEGDPLAAGEPPHADLGAAVRTDEGEIFWTLDPAKALAGVPVPEIAPGDRGEAPAPAEPTPLLTRDEVEPLDAVVPPAATDRPAPAPLAAEEAAEVPAALPHPPPAPGPRRALVAEDSLAPRLFLTRLLEREGFSVRAVTTATELLDELVDEGWSLVLVDVELPSRDDADVLDRAASRLSTSRVPLVALIRDAADLAVAGAAGVSHTLRKPFDPEAVRALLASLGLEAEPSA